MLTGLNEAQRSAVEYCDGPSLVIAGAGSGKTRVLTYKIAYLLRQGLEPWSIMALTFTNKAADEMKSRVGQLVGEERSRYLWMGTFHSVFLRILRYEHEAVGFQPNFTIYDASDSGRLVKNIINGMGLDEKNYRPSNVAASISAAKNRLVTAQAYNANPDNRAYDAQRRVPHLGEIYTRYAQRLRQANAMDFDDILLFTYLLFENHKEICRKYADRLRFVLVDEYQDTNFAQHLIVWQLTHERQRVCVVGDDAQSIYSFRGANIDNILRFKEFYPSMKLFKLEQNYRSTQTIVNAANSLIHHNRGQIKKTVFSHLDEGEPLEVCHAFSDVEEGKIVLRKINALRREEHLGYSDFAILYRTNAQSRIFEEELRKDGVPYRIVGGLSFYQRKEIKDVIAYMRLAVNRDDEEAFRRVVNYPRRGIGDTTVERVANAAVAGRVSLWKVAANPDGYGVAVAPAAKKKLQGFCALVEEAARGVATEDAFSVAKALVGQSGIYHELLLDNSPEGQTRRENVDELMAGVREFVESRREEDNGFVGLAEYLSEISLISDLEQGDAADESRVTLMTVHSAKGLEFHTVFVVGLEENLFPNQMAMGSSRQLEEERRLFYVAITRAKRHCFLSYANSRYRYGKMEFANPSRFIADIDGRYLHTADSAASSARTGGWGRGRSFFNRGGMERQERRAFSRDTELPLWQDGGVDIVPRVQSSANVGEEHVPAASVSQPASSVPTSAPASASYKAGDEVIHERFGRGVIISTEGAGAAEKALVKFENAGVKKLLLRFARLRLCH